MLRSYTDVLIRKTAVNIWLNKCDYVFFSAATIEDEYAVCINANKVTKVTRDDVTQQSKKVQHDVQTNL